MCNIGILITFSVLTPLHKKKRTNKPVLDQKVSNVIINMSVRYIKKNGLVNDIKTSS